MTGKGRFKNFFCPLLAAFIWGTAFVAQKVNTMGSLTFNASRSIIATVFLIILILILTKGDVKHLLREETKEGTEKLWKGGILCGIALSIATFCQQYGMDHGVEAGKAGFITALYMVFVALVGGILLHKKIGAKVWSGIGIAVIGLYFLCVRGDFSVRPMDLVVLMAAVGFTFQILFIDHYSVFCNCVKMSCIQFMTSFVLSGIGALLLEDISIAGISANLRPVLYLGIFSSGIAYTLQMVAQKGSNPALVSLLMSMESVFSVLSAAVILKERLTVREYIGCGIMLFAVILTQLPSKRE